MPKYKFYIAPGFSISQWYAFNLTPTLINDYFTTGSDSLLFGGYATPTEIASGTVDRWLRVYPGVSRDMSIEYDIWDHKHREKLKGDVVFMNNQIQQDFTILSEINNTTLEVKFRIELDCTTTASDWWEGYFSIVDGRWDADRGLFVVNPSPDDTYRHIEEQGDRKFNLYELNPSVVVGIDSSTTQTLFNSECTALSKEAYESLFAVPPWGGVWTDYTYIGTDPCYGTNVIHVWEKIFTDPIDFGNGRGLLLNDAISHIATTLGGIEYKSTFLNNDEYPTGNPNIPIGTKNYVTNATPNPLNGMVLMQKSNVKPTSDSAKSWLISFNEITDILKNMFNVDWFIDGDDKFRIEHWSYFEQTTASDIDLTTLDGGKWATHKNNWEYEIQEMPNREHFEWMEAMNPDFIGKDIIYNSIATGNRYSDNIKSRTVPVSTDAQSISTYPESITNEGWVILTVASDIILNEVGVLSTLTLPNNHLSWANLHDRYWRHGRVIEHGNMNGSDVIFESYQRNIKQTEITYPECCGAFDPMAYKITGLGEGQVRAASYRLIDGTVKSVFFYLNVTQSGKLKTSEFPDPETYYIMLNDMDIWLSNDLDTFIHHG
jgi:hypothetical protein